MAILQIWRNFRIEADLYWQLSNLPLPVDDTIESSKDLRRNNRIRRVPSFDCRSPNGYQQNYRDATLSEVARAMLAGQNLKACLEFESCRKTLGLMPPAAMPPSC